MTEKPDMMISLKRCYHLPSAELDADTRRLLDKSLVDMEQRWDKVDLDELLPVQGGVEVDHRFGYVLRHYWVPDAELTYRESAVVEASEESRIRVESQIKRNMVIVDTDQCTWRERVHSVAVLGDTVVPLVSPRPSAPIAGVLYESDWIAGTLRQRRPESRRPPSPAGRQEARRLALWSLPVVRPPIPVQRGDSWEVWAEEDHLRYRVTEVHKLGSGWCLVVVRDGTMRLPGPAPAVARSWEPPGASGLVHRQGVAVISLTRSLVLEERSYDRIFLRQPGENRDKPSLVVRRVCRLIRSCVAADARGGSAVTTPI